MNLDRRELLKILGLSVSAAAVPGCRREAHNLVPFLLPDEEIIPGIANWYASLCQECEAGCGTIVRVMEGRAKKIEGNPEHPVNRGKLCARGHASLQALYNPDRVRTPLKRVGDRGEGRFEPLSWSDAMDQWCELVRRHPNSLLVTHASQPGSEAELLSRFMQSSGGSALFFTPEETVAIRAAMQHSFNVDALPHYDLARCDYLLSLGAPFLEHWLSPVSLSMGYGEMRQGRPARRGQFVHIEPRLSLTAANADRWLPIRPGTEALLTMALLKALIEERHVSVPTEHKSRWSNWLSGVSLYEVARQTEIPEQDIRRIVHELAQASAPLVFAGGPATAHTNGTYVLQATNALNMLLGAVNQGTMRFPTPVALSAGPHPVAEQALLSQLAKVLKSGGGLQVYNLDLLHLLPPSCGIHQILRVCPFLVSFNCFLDETTLMADLVLPVHTPLESWGDHVYSGEAGRSAAGLQQPVVQPLYESRAMGDLVLDAAKRLDHGETFPWPTFEAFLQARWEQFLPFDEQAWVRHLQQGGWWKEEPARVPTSVSLPGRFQAAEFDGSPDDFPFFFYPFPSLSLHRGEGANRPWLQELPDPLMTAVWGTWIEINPTTAHRLGLKEGHMARVSSPYGNIEAPILYHPGTRPDLVSMPLGQGHQAYGRYAAGRGANPLTLLGTHVDRGSGRIASGATRVRVEPTGSVGRVVRLAHPGTQDDNQLIHIERRHVM
jgi:anaerobic selenocysteine-containing dehydrogenase